MKTKKAPNPGSPKAVDAGCTCPVLDNAHGRGTWGTFNAPQKDKLFCVCADCPLHGQKGKK